MSVSTPTNPIPDVLALLDEHYQTFFSSKPYADKTDHPVPCDTRAWSQIVLSLLTGIPGRKRKKGSDLSDGSDVKAANCWSAIDTPRFNNAIPAGRTSKTSRKAGDISALDGTPYIFFVLWDDDTLHRPRCRIWCVRATKDRVFRGVCKKWYAQRTSGDIKSDNFQLHPPRFTDNNIIRNKCGNLEYPLLFCATRKDKNFTCDLYHREVLTQGVCKPV